MRVQCFLQFWILLSAVVAVTAFHPQPNQFSLYSGPPPQYGSPKPAARHKNHCAYVVEKTVSYSVQGGAAPFVKADYNKCAWGQKCPALKYRMFYKPMYKVAYKTLTELEWKCCPGYGGVGCTAVYGMKSRPTFKGPMPAQKGPMSSFKGPMPAHNGPMPTFKGPMPVQKGPMPSFKGPMPMQKGPMPPFKGPMPAQKGPVHSYKGPMPAQKGPRPSIKSYYPSKKGPMPYFKGQMPRHSYDGNPWNQPQAPSNSMNGYQGPNTGPTFRDTSFEAHPDHQGPEVYDPELMPEPENPGHDLIHEGPEPITDYQDPQPEIHGTIPQGSETEPVPNAQTPSGGSETSLDHDDNSIEDERLDRLEEDVQRLSLGLETLRGTVTGLENSLRASLREDANRMLTALISAAPSPIAAPSLSRDTSVGFGDLPGGAPDIKGSDVMGQFPNLVDLAESVSELRAELVVQTSELAELKGAVLGHNNTLQILSEGTGNLTQADFQNVLETLVESKMREARVAILDRFEKRVESAEERCEGRVAEVRLQCKDELLNGQDQTEKVLDITVTGLRTELQKLQAQLQDLEPEEGCCFAVSGVTERVVYLEKSVGGLNESQIHLSAELGGHKDHIEGMLEGRLGYVEDKLNIAINQEETNVSKKVPSSIEAQIEKKLMALENRLLAAMEEFGNVSSPALLEGQAVPILESEVESLRKKVEEDLDRVQEQLRSIEVHCTSSCVPQPVLTGYAAPLATEEERGEEIHMKLDGKLDLQAERLNRLNTTLSNLLIQLAEKQEVAGLQDEVTLLKVTVNSVNRSLCGLQESLGSVIKEVGHTNFTWQEREERLVQQVKGVVQLVGRQASMLGTGERRLTHLKGELHDLRRRVSGDLKGCRSTTLGVQKEVTEVGGRVTRVEGQCGGLAHLAEDLERIRGELERHSDGYLSHVNSTLVNHSHQLSELRDSLQNCTGPSGFNKIAGDNLLSTTQKRAEHHTTEPTHPRRDQFAVPTQDIGV
ncbi:EMILIN-3-like [Xyrauchen texanus]|uniref:EMILIN-3-like n=1 Tax=Xyrauchen texanus TaxID=154827 RepID=UPI002241C66A|nr:EMILIN-3-like [Xyrauchen texanus]